MKSHTPQYAIIAYRTATTNIVAEKKALSSSEAVFRPIILHAINILVMQQYIVTRIDQKNGLGLRP